MTAASADPASRLDRAWNIVAAALPATPLVASPALGDGLRLRLETFQPTGSFKVRGALAALSEAGTSHGVVTASTGNHALGVAYAAHRLGIPATVVVPASASPAKLATLRRFPATVIVHGDSYEQAEQHARSLASNGLRYLSASSPRTHRRGCSTSGPARTATAISRAESVRRYRLGDGGSRGVTQRVRHGSVIGRASPPDWRGRLVVRAYGRAGSR